MGSGTAVEVERFVAAVALAGALRAAFEGSPNDRPVQLALEELGFFCKKVQVLGVYPADPARYGGN